MPLDEQSPADDLYVCTKSGTQRPIGEDPELRLLVPTYFGHRNCVLGVEKNEEFDNPNIPVLVRPAEGVRVVLGTHDYEDYHAPDIQIERRPKGWAIFLHPSGGDPSGYVYFLDDGRSFLVRELGSDAIEVIDELEVVPEVDDLPAKHSKLAATGDSNSPPPAAAGEPEMRECGRCEQLVADSGDWYGDLCPECADATDGDWICPRCGARGDFESMGGSGAGDPECCGNPCERIVDDD
jgi:hypothetical protein